MNLLIAAAMCFAIGVLIWFTLFSVEYAVDRIVGCAVCCGFGIILIAMWIGRTLL